MNEKYVEASGLVLTCDRLSRYSPGGNDKRPLRPSVRIAGFRAEIGTENLLNTKQELLSTLLRRSFRKYNRDRYRPIKPMSVLQEYRHNTLQERRRSWISGP
jgi:hypothetical protein